VAKKKPNPPKDDNASKEPGMKMPPWMAKNAEKKKQPKKK
jgi:hypothetical protein